MRRIAIRISYVAIPVLAVVAFMFVQQQLDGLAPAPPAAVPSSSQSTPVKPPQTPQQPTVLAPEDAAAAPLPSAQQATGTGTNVIQANYEMIIPAAESDVRTAAALEDDFFIKDDAKYQR